MKVEDVDLLNMSREDKESLMVAILEAMITEPDSIQIPHEDFIEQSQKAIDVLKNKNNRDYAQGLLNKFKGITQ